MKLLCIILLFPISISFGCTNDESKARTQIATADSTHMHIAKNTGSPTIDTNTLVTKSKEKKVLKKENQSNEFQSPSLPNQTPIATTGLEELEEKVKQEPSIHNQDTIASPQQEALDPSLALVNPVSHSSWDKLLKKYVSKTGKVNYKGIQAESAALQSYLNDLSKQIPASSWNKNEQLTYWINAYNAFTVKLIIDNYPLASITDLKEPWDQPFIKLGEKTYSLNNIEHDIIRKRFDEPRIHFAVNCAAKSCPPLLNEAYTADKLEVQLQRQTLNFINHPQFNKLSKDKVELSSIFDWYKDDFIKQGDLISYLNKYARLKVDPTAHISYLNYNWQLNE